jgi:D-sedoheptulose 7-phosphate isomerase
MHFFKQYASDLQRSLLNLRWNQIDEVVHLLHQARINGKQVFVMGNGGSAATATHMACDLNKNTLAPAYPRFRVIALTDNISALSAWANDSSYEDVFSEQLANFVQEGDVVLAISASGNSSNVLKAIQLARTQKAITVGWSGYDGGKLATLVDVPVVVRSHSIEQIEDIHLILQHMVTAALRTTALENSVQRRELAFA